MPLFGKSQKSPAELVKALKEAVTALERGDKKAEKAQEDVSKNLVSYLMNHKSEVNSLKTVYSKLLTFILVFLLWFFLGSYQKYVVRYIRFGAAN